MKVLHRLCFEVPLSEGDRLFEAGVEKLFCMKSAGELGPGRFLAFVGQRSLTLLTSSSDHHFYQV